MDFSLTFPGCFASGLAALPPGQKHSVVCSSFNGFSKQQREPSQFILFSIIRYRGSRVLSTLVGSGVKPQRFPHVNHLSSNLIYNSGIR